MVDQIIRPADLPNRASPNASEKIPVDNGSNVGGATVESIVLAGRPTASQVEAEAGTDAVKAMTPLTTKQAVTARIGVDIASAAQGGKADTALQEIIAGANTTVDITDPLRPVVSSSGQPSVGFKSDIVVVDGQTDWRVARNYKTVSELLADDGSGDMGMGYAGSGANVVVSPGDIITAQGFRYEAVASSTAAFDKDTAPDGYHLETAGGVKVIIDEPVINPAMLNANGDGSTPASALVQKAADIAVALGKELRSDVVNSYFLDAPLNLRYLKGCDLKSAFVYDDEDMIPITIGSSSLVRHDYIMRLGNISWTGSTGVGPTRNKPNQPMLRITGAKNMVLHYGNIDYVQIYSDTDDGTTTSVAYCMIYPQQSEWFEITTNPAPVGSTTQWSNDNKIYGGRLRRIIVSGTYGHNRNYWYNPSMETDGVIDFQVGRDNRVLDTRLEGGGITVNFGSDTSNNLVTQSWTNTPRDGILPYGSGITVTDLGTGNMVINDRMAYMDRVVMFDLQYGSDNLASATSQVGVNASALSKSGRGWIAAAGLVFTSPWIKCRAGSGIDIKSTASIWRSNITFYDASGAQVTSATDPGLLSSSSYTWSSTNNRYERNSNFEDIPSPPLVMTDTGWFVFTLSSAATTVFQSVQVVGFAPMGENYETLSGMQPKFYTPPSALIESATAAQLASASSTINTVGKFAGRLVWDSTNLQPVWAVGPSAANSWRYADGTTAVTPS